jgi:arylsulfatase A-like enzyme
MYDPSTIDVPKLLRARQKNVPGEEGRKTRWDREDGEELIRTVIAYYWGMMTCIDDMMGRIMDVMTRRGLWENTLVIFTTDHGEMLGDFGRTGKGNFTEQVIRPPYILVPPGSRERERPLEAHGQVEHIDLVPTIMDYVGMEKPAELPGVSLRAALESDEGARTVGKEAVLCDNVDNGQRRRQKCLRTERFKYVVTTDTQTGERFSELYDLREDPRELVNVAGEARYKDEVQRHAEMLLERLMTTEKNAWNSGGHLAAPIEEMDFFGRRVTAVPELRGARTLGDVAVVG